MVNLDEHRAEELEQVLKELSSRIVAYVKKADSPGGVVGQHKDPNELVSTLKIGLGSKGQGLSGLLETTDEVLSNSVVTWHKTFLEKLYAATNPVGVASDLLLSILNTNSHVFTASPALTVIEKHTGREYARLFGFDGPRAGGLTFPGGSYSNITSMHIARAILHPETGVSGNSAVRGPLVVFTSAHSHYSVEKSAILLGLGSANVRKVPVNEKGEMIVSELERAITESKANGEVPFYVNATAGTTVYGSFDDTNSIADICDVHGLWLHVDGSWGGNVVWSSSQRHKLYGSHRARSLTVNPHKMLGVPCTCSFLLVPDTHQFQANSLSAPYLFHNNGDDDDSWDLADGTMGCGRRADALKLYLGWQWYGAEGYAMRIDHAFEISAYLANRVAALPDFVLLSEQPPPCLQVCFFYAPGGELGTADQNTQRTRKIAKKLFADSKFLVDYSPHPEHGEFFRVVVNAPSVDREVMNDLLAAISSTGKSLGF